MTEPVSITPAMARRIEIWPTDRLVPYAKNARTHSPEQVAQIAASIVEFGFVNPILVDSMDGIIAGHGRLLAARKLGLAEVPVVVLGHLSEIQRRAYIIADNQLALNAGWNDELLRGVLESLGADGFDLSLVGFSDEELVVLLGSAEPEAAAAVEEEAVPEPPAQPVTMPGDVWLIGRHRLICGDCRDVAVVEKLMAGASANVAITSPPYATQREYDPTSGFKPVPPEEYVAWFRAVAAGIEAVLAPDGSYFLNIKAHADEGERNLYVMDLVLAHRRRGAGGSWMSSAGARPTTACLAVGETGLRMRSSRSTTSAGSSRSSSGRRLSGMSPRTALTTPRTIRYRGPGAVYWAPDRAANPPLCHRRDRRRGVTCAANWSMASMRASRARAT